MARRRLTGTGARRKLHVNLISLRPRATVTVLIGIIGTANTRDIVEISFAANGNPVAAVTTLGRRVGDKTARCRVALTSTCIACIGNEGMCLRSTANKVLFFTPGASRNCSTNYGLDNGTSNAYRVCGNVPRLGSVRNRLLVRALGDAPYCRLALSRLLSGFSTLVDYHILLVSIAIASKVNDSSTGKAVRRGKDRVALCSGGESVTVRSGSAKGIVICPACCSARLRICV